MASHRRYRQLLGTIVNPLGGDVKEEIVSPRAGLLFTLREYPVVYPYNWDGPLATGAAGMPPRLELWCPR